MADDQNPTPLYSDLGSGLADLLGVTPDELTTALGVLSKITNLSGSGSGTGLPPTLAAGFSVPPVTNVRAANIGSVNGATKVAVTWTDAKSGLLGPVDHYNVYMKRLVATSSTQQAVLVSASAGSPAVFTVTPDGANSVQILIQTVMQNGYLLPMTQCPTTTVVLSSTTIPPPAFLNSQLFITGLTFTDNSPGAGSIAWSSCTVYYGGNTYAIASGSTSDTFVGWTVGNLSFTGFTDSTWLAGPTVFLIATNYNGAHDAAWNKIASGGVTHDMMATPLTYLGRNGTLQVNGVTFTDNNPSVGRVSWSTGQITYQGQTYTLTASNTGSGSGGYIYWQLASPTVFSFQAGPPIPSLTDDDFLIGVSDGGGVFENLIETHGPCTSYMTSGGAISSYNANEKFVATMGTANAGVASTFGQFVLGDGLGNAVFLVDANPGSASGVGRITFPHAGLTGFTGSFDYVPGAGHTVTLLNGVVVNVT